MRLLSSTSNPDQQISAAGTGEIASNLSDPLKGPNRSEPPRRHVDPPRPEAEGRGLIGPKIASQFHSRRRARPTGTTNCFFGGILYLGTGFRFCAPISQFRAPAPAVFAPPQGHRSPLLSVIQRGLNDIFSGARFCSLAARPSARFGRFRALCRFLAAAFGCAPPPS